jgi:transposase
VHEAPPPSGVHPLSERHRGQRAQEKTIHVIVDNYATHKHPDVMEWLEKHRRFVFTPTSASWLNAIVGFFAKLTKGRLKRGVFRSLRELKDAIHRFLDHTNANPKPFTWTKKQNHRRCQTGAPSVRFDPLATYLAGLQLRHAAAACRHCPRFNRACHPQPPLRSRIPRGMLAHPFR